MFETKITNLPELKESYDEDGFNHIPELFSKSDMEIILDFITMIMDKIWSVEEKHKDIIDHREFANEHGKLPIFDFYNEHNKKLDKLVPLKL